MKKKAFWLIGCVLLVVVLAATLFCDPTTATMPAWLSIVPPLVAIVMALIIKEVLSSLFVGILIGAFFLALYSGHTVAGALGTGLLRVADTYVVGALADPDHVTIIVFTLFIGAMVRLMTDNGAMRGLVKWLSRKANTPRKGLLITYILGIIIFFDDYANTLVVGNTMRPITDRLKVSREKLAYIVDSSSAPVVAIAFITTWIGAELSYIQSGIDAIGLEASAYSVFFHSLAYSFYPILTLLFLLFIILMGRDFGPMLKVERAQRQKEIVEETAETDNGSGHSIDALLPIIVLILGTLGGLLATGYDAEIWQDSHTFMTKISMTIGQSNSYVALLRGSLIALLVTIAITLWRGVLSFSKIMESIMEGFKSMLPAVVILTMAWATALITKDMHTAEFVSQLLVTWSVPAAIVPVMTFVLAFFISFATGTSWGTMSILYPLILPASWLVAQKQGLDMDSSMMTFYLVVATVMAGAVFGDHCSPISDTTIMSSTSSGCHHIDHVRTQMPYALTVGGVSLVCGILPAGLGIPFWVCFAVSIVALWCVVRFVGKKVEV